MDTNITDNKERHRFELRLDDRVAGWIDYFRTDGVVAMTHAEVQSDLRNQGHGDTLVREALEQVREEGAKVRPLCPFVAAYVRRHPELEDLVA
jgi:predicted GNAT family acetyltransferase